MKMEKVISTRARSRPIITRISNSAYLGTLVHASFLTRPIRLDNVYYAFSTRVPAKRDNMLFKTLHLFPWILNLNEKMPRRLGSLGGGGGEEEGDGKGLEVFQRDLEIFQSRCNLRFICLT